MTDPAKDLVDARAERMVIGWMQINPADAQALGEIVTAESFGDPDNATAFEAVCATIEAAGEVDYVALRGQLVRLGRHNTVGIGYVAECASVLDEYGFGLTSSAAFGAAALVAELATRRRIVVAAQTAMLAARTLSRPVAEVADLASVAMTRAASEGAPVAGRSFGDATVALFARLANPEATRASWPLPWRVLSQRLGGLRRKRLHILAGRFAMGKSALALNLALALAAPSAWWSESHVDPTTLAAPVPVLFFALEMADEENAARGLATLAGITAQQIETGEVPGLAWPALQTAGIQTRHVPLQIDDRTTSIVRMRAIARAFFAKHGPGMMVVDYLQLVSPKGLDDVDRHANREQKVAAMTKEFKRIAMDLDIAVLLLAQLNRAAAGGEGKRPCAENLRESGAQEQDADVICLLWGDRPAADDLTQEVKVAIEKVRGGAAGGDVPMIFTRRSTRFEESPEASLEASMGAPAPEASYAVGGWIPRVVRGLDDTGTEGGE